MPQYLIYKGRKCGSTARGTGSWTKAELLNEAKLLEISTSGNLTDICQRLIDHMKIAPQLLGRQEAERRERQKVERRPRQAENIVQHKADRLKRFADDKKLGKEAEKKRPPPPPHIRPKVTKFYRERRCGTHERGAGAFTRAELLNEAKLRHVSVTGTMDEICRRLIDKEVLDAQKNVTQKTKVSPKPAPPIVPPKKKSKNTKNCKNETSLIGDDFDEMIDDEIIQDNDGNCYTPNELIQTLGISQKNESPFTRKPLWVDRASFDKLFSHPGFSDADRSRMVSIFYPVLGRDIIDLVKANPDLFNLIGMTGAVLKADYGQEFKASSSMLVELNKELDKLDEPTKNQFKKLKEINGNQSLGKIIKESNLTCIHCVGADILGIYLNTWFNIPEEERPPLIEPLYITAVNSAVVFGYTTEQGRYFELYMFKFDSNINNILNINYLTNASGSWTPGNMHHLAVQKIPPGTLARIEQDVIEHADVIMVKYGILREYLTAKGFEDL